VIALILLLQSICQYFSPMTQSKMYQRHRFPPEIIQYAVWLYHRFNLSHRDIEDLLAERSIEVSYEAIRLWCNKFGPKYAQRLRRKHQGYGDTFFIDEVFVKIQGVQHYLWRAVDQDGEVVDVFCKSVGMAKPLNASLSGY
jgi:putative transposase